LGALTRPYGWPGLVGTGEPMIGGRHPIAMVGTGRLKSADGRVLIEEARYVVAVRRGAAADGADAIEGRIFNPPQAWGFDAALVGTAAVLQLSTGDEWECVISNHRVELLSRGRRGLFRSPADPRPLVESVQDDQAHAKHARHE
jgi:hypothetical protein